jgi:hypothetical protein
MHDYGKELGRSGNDNDNAATTRRLDDQYLIPYNKFFQTSSSQQQHAGFLNFAAQAMARHREQVQAWYSPAYTVNFWENPLSLTELAENIWNATQHSLSPNVRQQYQEQGQGGGLRTIKLRQSHDT